MQSIHWQHVCNVYYNVLIPKPPGRVKVSPFQSIPYPTLLCATRCPCFGFLLRTPQPLASVRLLSLTIVLGDDVRQVTGPLDAALSQGGRQVVSAAYRELQAFFGRVDRWSGPGEEEMVEPMGGLARLLTRDGDAVESVRKGRAEAVLAFLGLRKGVRGVPDGLGEALRGWRAGERAGGVQGVLDECLGLMDSAR
jgi:hypothetical protein